MKDFPRMAARTSTLWRNAAGTGVTLLLIAVGGLAVWYRATYHTWPGAGIPDVVHWCGRDYQHGVAGPQSWVQVTAQAPVAVKAVGYYPPLGPGRLLLAGSDTSPPAGQVCAMAVYLRTSPGRYQPYTLEGGP
jgi:hypothetical protein